MTPSAKQQQTSSSSAAPHNAAHKHTMQTLALLYHALSMLNRKARAANFMPPAFEAIHGVPQSIAILLQQYCRAVPWQRGLQDCPLQIKAAAS
jgi:hypothetical protein